MPIKVFSATKARDREALGEAVTKWLADNRAVGVRAEVKQSSDREFHCMSIVIWYELQATEPRRVRTRHAKA